jgi:excisionase family DNA binding protein
MKDYQYLTITEVSNKMGVTRQALYTAIKRNRLKSSKHESRKRYIHRNDLEDFLKNRYSRNFSTYNGKLLFDPSKGNYSIKQAAGKLNIPIQKVYYMIRSKKLKYVKHGGAYVITQKNLDEYKPKKGAL